MLLSFCGSGFLGLYHLGVSNALATRGLKLLNQVDKYAGASAGALVACLLSVTNNNIYTLEKCTHFCYHAAREARKQPLGVLTPGFSLVSQLEAFIPTVLPADAYNKATGHLYISLTRKRDLKNVLLSQFTSNNHLLKCLLASCCIPYFTSDKNEGITIGNEVYIDGGFTNNLPTIDGQPSVLVAPFAGNHDICPRDNPGANIHVRLNNQRFKVNALNVVRGVHCLFPPPEALMKTYYDKGYKDALRFLKERGYL